MARRSWTLPDVRRLGSIAQGLERDLHLHRPAAVEATGPHVPHRVPVVVGVPLVRELRVRPRPEGVGVEVEAVAPVVERIEQHAEEVVLAELAGVAAHLVRYPPALGRRVPHPRRDVDVRVVEQDPRLRPLGRRLPRIRHQLHQARDGRHGGVDRLVEHAVEVEPLVVPDRADRHPPLVVASRHRRGHRRRGAVDERGIDYRRRLILRRGANLRRPHRHGDQSQYTRPPSPHVVPVAPTPARSPSPLGSLQPGGPEPPPPLAVSSSVSTSTISTSTRLCTTSCPTRIPAFTSNLCAPWLMRTTPISPRYPSSIVPGLLSTVTVHSFAKPLRGRISATVPRGSAIAIPVGTTRTSPGSSTTSAAAYRSSPASPGCAYLGITAPALNLLILICMPAHRSPTTCSNPAAATTSSHIDISAKHPRFASPTAPLGFHRKHRTQRSNHPPSRVWRMSHRHTSSPIGQCVDSVPPRKFP